jgi:hypothetical protein
VQQQLLTVEQELKEQQQRYLKLHEVRCRPAGSALRSLDAALSIIGGPLIPALRASGAAAPEGGRIHPCRAPPAPAPAERPTAAPVQEHRLAAENAEREGKLRADKDEESSSLAGQMAALQSEKRQLLSFLEDKRAELGEKRCAGRQRRISCQRRSCCRRGASAALRAGPLSTSRFPARSTAIQAANERLLAATREKLAQEAAAQQAEASSSRLQAENAHLRQVGLQPRRAAQQRLPPRQLAPRATCQPGCHGQAGRWRARSTEDLEGAALTLLLLATPALGA